MYTLPWHFQNFPRGNFLVLVVVLLFALKCFIAAEALEGDMIFTINRSFPYELFLSLSHTHTRILCKPSLERDWQSLEDKETSSLLRRGAVLNEWNTFLSHLWPWWTLWRFNVWLIDPKHVDWGPNTGCAWMGTRQPVPLVLPQDLRHRHTVTYEHAHTQIHGHAHTDMLTRTRTHGHIDSHTHALKHSLTSKIWNTIIKYKVTMSHKVEIFLE